MNNLLFYGHAGSKNHGCEAIVRSTINILGIKPEIVSLRAEDDFKYKINYLADIKQANEYKYYSLRHIIYKIYSIMSNKKDHYYKYQYKQYFNRKKNIDIALSIGGDNYCYDSNKWLTYLNNEFNKLNIKTVLWGCSVNEDVLKDPNIIIDLNQYSLITVRETITFQNLKSYGVKATIKLYPDPAFILEKKISNLNKNIILENTVGINISPLLQKIERDKSDIIYNNYYNLIIYILNTTDMNIALIPHVVIEETSDLEPIKKLYSDLNNSYRVQIIDIDMKMNCMELKFIISKCRFMIVARTHASIAAYSTCVPTIVVGYSVKAKGIARDIFGNYENYVLPIQSLKKEDDLLIAFNWLRDNECSIRTHLQKFMPSYINEAWKAGDEIREIVQSLR